MKVKKNIKEPYRHTFKISKSGLVVIFVSARCKAKGQDGLDNDEDLRVEINGLSFREIPPEKNIQLYNIPPAFNGSKLKGLKKKVIFLTVLKKGENFVDLIPQNSAFIEDIKIQELASFQDLNFEINEKAEDGDRRLWITLVLINLPLKSLIARAITKWRFRDSDDIKLIIDGEIQKSKGVFSKWENWLWSGSVFRKFFQKETQTKIIKPNLSQDIHYIEFYADRMPILHNVKLDFGKEIDFCPRAKVIWSYTKLREEPNTKSEIIIEKINKGEIVVILERAEKGERYRNETNGKLLATNRWHKVEYQRKVGYIYSLALEISGEDKRTIQKLIAKTAREFDVNPEILLALAQCESNFFPYTVSFDEKRPEVAFGVMQISEDLLKDLNNKTKQFYSPVDNVFDMEQNVQGGISYFNYLYNKKYKNDKDRLRKSVAAYNAGPGYVGVNEPLELHLYDSETQRIVPCIQNHLRKETFKKILKSLGKIGLGLFLVFQLISFYEVCFEPEDGVIFYSGNNITANIIAGKTGSEFSGPDIIWDSDSGNLTFYNTKEKEVAVMSANRLNLGKVFDIISEFSSSDSIHVGHCLGRDILEPFENIFYFPVSTFYMCGVQNCTYALFRFDVNNNKLELIDNNILGASISLYLSPDNRYLAIVRGVHGGICNAGNYLKVIDLINFEKDKVDELMNGNKDYTINFIKSLKWINNDEIEINTEQYNCDEGGILRNTFIYNVGKQAYSVQKK